MPSVLAVSQGLGHYRCHAGIPQPYWPESSSIHLAVQGDKRLAG